MARKHIVSQLATKRDWILTAEEAVRYGFADGILGTKKYPNIDYPAPIVDHDKERADISKLGVVEVYRLLGGGGELYVNGELVIKND